MSRTGRGVSSSDMQAILDCREAPSVCYADAKSVQIPRANANALFREVIGLRESFEAYAVSRDDWWATYRAALTGLLAGDPRPSLEDVHRSATDAANRAHGKLKP